MQAFRTLDILTVVLFCFRISMAEIRSADAGLSRRLIDNPTPHIRALESACHTVASEFRQGYDKENERIRVGLTGPIGASPLSPRSLNSSALRQLICVEGVATKVRIRIELDVSFFFKFHFPYLLTVIPLLGLCCQAENYKIGSLLPRNKTTFVS